MTDKKRKRGRPKSKVKRRQYLAERFLRYYQEYLELSLEQAIGRLAEEGRLEKGFRPKFFRRELLDNETGERATSIVDFLDQENVNFETTYPKARSEDARQWFFLVGLYYGSEIIAKDVLSQLLDNRMFNISSATDLMRVDKERGDSPVRPASDLYRQMKASEISRDEVVGFTRRIKEMRGRRYIDDVAKKLSLSVLKVRKLCKEAKRQVVSPQLSIEKDNNGREFIRIE